MLLRMDGSNPARPTDTVFPQGAFDITTGFSNIDLFRTGVDGERLLTVWRRNVYLSANILGFHILKCADASDSGNGVVCLFVCLSVCICLSVCLFGSQIRRQHAQKNTFGIPRSWRNFNHLDSGNVNADRCSTSGSGVCMIIFAYDWRRQCFQQSSTMTSWLLIRKDVTQ